MNIEVYDARPTRPHPCDQAERVIDGDTVRVPDDDTCDHCRWPLGALPPDVRVFPAADTGGQVVILTCAVCAGRATADRPQLGQSGQRYSVLR